MQNLVPDKLIRCGLTADYSLECLKFLRQHVDIDDPDPATIASALSDFKDRMEQLFVKGWILGDPSSGSTASGGSTGSTGSTGDDALGGDRSCPGKTVTQCVFEQIDDPEPMLVWWIGQVGFWRGRNQYHINYTPKCGIATEIQDILR